MSKKSPTNIISHALRLAGYPVSLTSTTYSRLPPFAIFPLVLYYLRYAVVPLSPLFLAPTPTESSSYRGFGSLSEFRASFGQFSPVCCTAARVPFVRTGFRVVQPLQAL